MGNSQALYFAFPTEQKEVVGKVKLAVEEIFKILEEQKQAKKDNMQKYVYILRNFC